MFTQNRVARAPVQLSEDEIKRILAAAIERGGVGCRVAFDALLAHPLLAPLAAEHQKSKLSALLPRDDKNDKGFYLESDGSHVVRLRPTPEVRQLRAAVDADAPAAEGDFSVFQFNILADMLATLEQFPTVDTTHLDWSRRRDLVLQEVGYHLPDIITLQEVQSTGGDGSANDHLAEIEGVLRTAHGYSTRYVRKVRWHGHGWPPGVAQIGNVISWRDEAFEFIAHKEVHIAPQLLVTPWVSPQTRSGRLLSKELWRRVHPRPRICPHEDDAPLTPASLAFRSALKGEQVSGAPLIALLKDDREGAPRDAPL